MNPIYGFALQENVAKILERLDASPSHLLTQEQVALKEKFYLRFRDQTETYAFKTQDSLVQQLMRLYQHYWKDVLLKKKPVAAADSLLREQVTAFLVTHQFGQKPVTKAVVLPGFTQHLKEFLKTRGLYAATGKTGSLYDLLLWAKESEVVYDVQLPEGKAKTKVVFLEEVVTLGWEEYATFGKYYPGGWSSREELHCVKSAYDLNSENFKVSYLQHEGQHFFSYQHYPKLTGADLEYRAKLTELAAAKETMYTLMNQFVLNASKEGRNAHAFGNYCVVRDLSRHFFKEEFVKEAERWKAIPVAQLNKVSLALLKQNSANLQKAGAATVTGFIK
ncbi:MAG: hypothetical protein ACO1OQ_03945 [Rufibacter sp.]